MLSFFSAQWSLNTTLATRKHGFRTVSTTGMCIRVWLMLSTLVLVQQEALNWFFLSTWKSTKIDYWTIPVYLFCNQWPWRLGTQQGLNDTDIYQRLRHIRESLQKIQFRTRSIGFFFFSFFCNGPLKFFSMIQTKVIKNIYIWLLSSIPHSPSTY